jgi:hypothetical protein
VGLGWVALLTVAYFVFGVGKRMTLAAADANAA